MASCQSKKSTLDSLETPKTSKSKSCRSKKSTLNSLETPTGNISSKPSSDIPFDLTRLHTYLLACQAEDGSIFIGPYIDTYAELCRFFHMLGSVFGFVSSDIRDKMRILQEYLQSESGEHYSTVQSMIKYEVSNNITIVKCRKANPSGCRTLLRLHRALQFVITLLKNIHTPQDKHANRMSNMAHEAYEDTLAKFHPWLVRKAVGFSFRVLPSRQELIHKMGNSSVDDDGECIKVLKDTILASQPIYDEVEKLFTLHKLHELP